jgi:hypothetical protein
MPSFFYSGGPPVYGKDGSLLQYILDTNNHLLKVWNTSRAIWYEDFFVANEYWMWRPTLNETFNGANGYSLNVSIPPVRGSIRAIREGEYIIGGTAGNNDETGVVQGTMWALSLVPGQEGTLLWNRTFTPPYDPVPPEVGGLFGAGQLNLVTIVPEYNVFIFSSSMTRQWWGYSLITGQQIWGPTDPEPAGNYYGMIYNVYDGKLLTAEYGGVLNAYDLGTGEKLWEYAATNVGYESPYGNYPIGIGAIADGKIYLTSSEHSPTQPLWRGSYKRCIDADTGEEVWKISMLGVSMPSGNAGSNYAVADGYLLALNGYDNRIYCYGKGPSETTVSVQTDVISWGDSVLFKGSVTDQSAGTKQLEQTARFPNGVPAIADEYMSDWMLYVYKQFECPMMLNGVEVKLETLDPNNNFYEIGRVTTDASGMYKLLWEPPVPGEYTIIATF